MKNPLFSQLQSVQLPISQVARRLLFVGLSIALLSIIALRLYLSLEAQAAANCSAPYLVDQTFANGARWQLCWEQRNLDGIVLRDVYFTPPGGVQQRVLAQAAISQVHVPYDDNSARFHDITDDGFGNENLNDLTPEECPGGMLLRDGSKDALCRQLQPRGYAAIGVGQQQQGEILTLFSVSTSGEYNYIPVWRFQDDGEIEMVMGATGKLQRFTINPDFGWPVRSGTTRGTSHIHNYYWRLDFDLGEEGKDDIVEEFNYAIADNQRTLGVTRLTTEAGRSISPQTMRSWRIRDGTLTNAHSRPISYHLEPMDIGHRDVGPTSEPWTTNDFYVTKYNACEKYVSHNPRVNGCGNNLAAFVNGETLTDADVVLWYGLTFHHVPRDEDELYMHAHWDGFRLVPRDWMATNPSVAAIDTCVVGDVTCDGNVDAADALFMLQFDVGLRTSNPQLPLPTNTLYGYSCDVSGEGSCDQVDALLTLQCSIGLGNLFCPNGASQEIRQATDDQPPATTFFLGTTTSELISMTVPIWLDAPTTIGSFSGTVRYDPDQIHNVQCTISEDSAMDLTLCHVDPVAGLVRLNSIAANGRGGEIELGTLRFDDSSDRQVVQPFVIESVMVTDSTGALMTGRGKQLGLEPALYLPLIMR